MSERYQVVGATQVPLFKVGLLTPMIGDGDSRFELGAFDSYRMTKQQFDDSSEAGTMVCFNEALDFPGTREEGTASDMENNPYRRGYCLFYLADEFKEALAGFEKNAEITGILSGMECRHKDGYDYYLLSDKERERLCKPLGEDYERSIRKKLREAPLIPELLRSVLCPISKELRETLKDDCAALLELATSPADLAKWLPLFLLLDGEDSWTEEDWKGLCLWAEDFGRKAGLDEKFNATQWEEKRRSLLSEINQ